MMRLLLTFFILATINVIWTSGLSPILIVPGYSGSRLEAKISDGSACDTGGKWVTYWVNVNKSVECINKVLSVKFDSSSGSYSNLPEIEVRAPGLGDTRTIEFLDEKDNGYSAYFHIFVNYFEAKGYVRGETICGAPYDWRLAADELRKKGYYDSVKALIEKMYNKHNTKVSIVVHSMGGPITLYFLNNVVSQDWKDKHINAFIPLSGAWSGGNSALLTFISAIHGSDSYERQFGISFQTMESTAWLLPNPSVWKDKVIVTTTNNNYSANEYEKLFDSINRKADFQKIKQTLQINGDYPAPNVTVHCFYGIGIPTVEVVNYGSGLPKTVKSITYGDGDSAVNLLSSQVCEQWSNQDASFYLRRFEKINHGEMVTAQQVLDAVAEAIQESLQ